MAVGGIQISFEYTVPVFSRFAPGWPTYGDVGLAPADRATYGPLADACAQAWEWDAHFAAYSAPHVPRRLATAASLEARPRMTLFVADVDGPGHQLTAEWWAGEKDKLRALFRARGAGYAYATKGGYRIVYGLAEPLELATTQDALRWRATYEDWLAILAEYKIAADDKCADWTRCYRLPRVRRDGVDVVPLEEFGSPSQVVPWRAPYAAPDDPRVLRPVTPLDIPRPPPVPDDKLQEAADALIASWPPRSRHYAGMALSGALAKAGWSEEAIADFVCYVMLQTIGDPEIAKWSKQAKDALDKLARGEEVTGWATLADLMCSGTDGQVDEARRETVEGAVGAARKMLGQGPPIELFNRAREAACESDRELVRRAAAELRPDVPGDDGLWSRLLNRAADEIIPAINVEKSKSLNPTPYGMSFDEIDELEIEEDRWLVRELIPARGVGAISAEPKVSKTWLGLEIAVSVASGTPVMSRFAVDRPGGAFYMALEDHVTSVRRRVRAIARGKGLEGRAWKKRLVIQAAGKPVDVTSDYHLCVLAASIWLAEERSGTKFDFFAIDPLSDAHSGEEDKRDSMVPVMMRLRALSNAIGLSLVFNHHAKKIGDGKTLRGGQKMRGSSAIHAAVDFGIYLDKPRGDRKSLFVCRAESETRSGRSAGTFDITLNVEDDDRGHAVKALFSWSECAEPEDGPSDLAEQRAFEVVKKLWDQGAPLSFDDLRRKIKGRGTILQEAIAIAVKEGWIEHRRHGSRAAGYEITDAGRALVRDGGEPGSDPGVIVDDQSGGAAPGKPPIHLAGFLGAIAQN